MEAKFGDVGHSVHFDALGPFVQDLTAFLKRVDQVPAHL